MSKGPDFRIRLGEKKDEWIAAARRDGFEKLGTWIKWVIETYLRRKDAP